jgi:hypothetical protein
VTHQLGKRYMPMIEGAMLRHVSRQFQKHATSLEILVLTVEISANPIFMQPEDTGAGGKGQLATVGRALFKQSNSGYVDVSLSSLPRAFPWICESRHSAIFRNRQSFFCPLKDTGTRVANIFRNTYLRCH